MLSQRNLGLYRNVDYLSNLWSESLESSCFGLPAVPPYLWRIIEARGTNASS